MSDHTTEQQSEKKTADQNCSSGQPAEDSYSVVIEKEGDRSFKCSIINRDGMLIATAELIEIEEGEIFHACNVRLVNQPWEPPS